ncbi:cation:proton antiporter [Alteromonas sp. ASW11-36]|uniref:Cation:proton antiporter n=1 Tax=Alteromonas arenosi TaxID=3055817 RepID=A0ABT7T0C0_9ALTE|nr:cation:proton antiporter [Alteromonas sp. ASW11-36]MDM7861257.1 cation:proton antiporter [Alteromonas sp. ASW11-36]
MDISGQASLFIAVGGLLLFSLLVNTIGQRTALPRVTLLLLLGVAVGEQGLNILPDSLSTRFDIIADVALLMVGFLMGGKLTIKELRSNGRHVLWISLCGAIVTAIVVTLVCVLIGVSPVVALLLGAIASATAPAAIYDVIQESHFAGPYTETLLAIVATDDAWALLLFGLCIAVSSLLNGHAADASVYRVMWDIGGAIFLGLAIGLPASYLTGRIKRGQPSLIEAMGCVLLCGGLAQYLEVSFLISAMIMGACITNLARHHDYPFHAIEDIEWPFMVLFFVLAGASIQLDGLASVGLLGLVYILARTAGKWLGAYVGAVISQAPLVTRHWLGIALLPQAGVGIGLALAASKYFPEHQHTLLTIIVSTTVFFELAGPILTKLSLSRARAQGLA